MIKLKVNWLFQFTFFIIFKNTNWLIKIMNEFSKTWMISSLSKVQKSNISKEYSTFLVDWINIKVILRYENWKYKWVVISNIRELTQEEVDFMMWWEILVMNVWEKWKFIEQMYNKVSNIKKRLVELWLIKISDWLDINLHEIDEVSDYDFMTVNDIDSTELEELWLVKETAETKRKKEREKRKYELLWELNIDIKDIWYEDERVWETEIYISNILKFPLRDTMIINVEPEFYVPYLYKINMENYYEAESISFISKWIVSDKMLISLLKKLKILWIQEVCDNWWTLYDVQEHLEMIIKNPYYWLNWKLANLMKNDTCRFCWSSWFVELTYSKLSTTLEVWWWQPTKVEEPFKYHWIWTIEKVVCWNCQRTLTTFQIDSKKKIHQKNISEIFPDFKCWCCWINAFQDMNQRRTVEVELSYPTLKKWFNAFSNNEESMELIKSWDITKIYCQEETCKNQKAFYK